ncbi:TPA: type VI secretion system Vgr family protein [Yersinia enterocolitica]
MQLGQAQRLIRWVGDIANDFALFEITGEEHFSQPYCYRACSRTAQTSEEVAHYLGKSLACQIGDAQRGRYIHGVVTALEEVNNTQGISTFMMTLEPQFSLLRLGRNLRVFQKTTVPDIVSKILREHNISQIDLRLRASYDPREYCIQYRESDFDFINRLLEQEGIYYYFQHDVCGNTLILADHPSSHPTAATVNLPFNPIAGKQEGLGALSWSIHSGMSASSVVLSGYNPDQAAAVEGRSLCIDAEYSADGVTFTDAIWISQREALGTAARLKMERLESDTQFFTGEINAYWLSCGERFTLTDHPSATGNYRIRSLYLSVSSNLEQGSSDFQCKITALNNDKTYRPENRTPLPLVSGVVTARVVGPQSEEIYTDEYGRIKIQFPWDKENSCDDSSSCWVRVSQPWCGEHFGAFFLPRVGSEVVVSFIQGNPDMPLVTGSVFNGANHPPLALPGDKTVSGFVSRSSQGGRVDEGNMLCFNDKKGEEKLTIVAQKDLNLMVNNAVVSEVSKTVNTKIGGNRSVEITHGNDRLTLKQGDYQLALNQGNYAMNVTGSLTSVLKSGDHKLSVSGGGSEMKTDKTMVLESLQSIELKVGSSKLSITPTGITLKALTICIEGSGTAELKGAMVTVNGSGMTQLKGGVTMIG